MQYDWEELRWRSISWENIPPDSRERIITFLMVPEVLSMTKAMTCHKNDDHLRKQLIKSYVVAKIPAFDKFLFSDADDFE